MSSRQSRLSQAYPQKMFYGLKCMILTTPGVGSKALVNALSEDKKVNTILLSDKATNVDYVIECFTNPKGLKNLSHLVCLLVVYDITSNESFERVCKSFESYEHLINKTYQFILLIGNKCDLEEYREVQTDQVELYAAEHQMIFFETSTLTGRNIEYVQKLIRVRSSQTMKKFQIQPTLKLHSNIIHEEDSESISHPTDSLLQESDSSSQSSACTPPKFPQRAELSPEYRHETPPPLPERGEDDDDSSQFPTPDQQVQGTQNETPERNDSPSRNRAPSLISDLAQRPSIQKNPGAKFKEAYRQSITTSQKKTSEKKVRIEKQLFEDETDLQMKNIEESLTEINKQLEKKPKVDPNKSVQENTSYRSEFSGTNTQRFFRKEEDKYIPIVDTFLYEENSQPQPRGIIKPLVRVNRSRSHSPLHQISSRLSAHDFVNSSSFAPTADPRLYSRNLKPVLFLAVEHESDVDIPFDWQVFFVEVYREDTLNLVTERVLHQIKAPARSKYIVRYIQAILEHAIHNFSKDLKNQLLIIEKRKQNKREALEMHFKSKIETMKQQLDTEKFKNNWTNPRNAIGKVTFAMPKGQPLTLHVHENDDPYDLAFFFILDNDLKKSKVQQIVAEITQVQRNFRSTLLTSQAPPAPTDDDGFIFKANFNLGQGRMIPVAIHEGEDVNKYVHKIVLEHKLKYEQYVKMVRIISEVIQKKSVQGV